MAEDISADKSPGRKAPRFPRLHVLTGFRDDPRRGLTPDDALYLTAQHALEQQDDWSYQEHDDFWAAALPQWPAAPGRRPSREGLSVAAAGLAAHGLALDEIAAALYIAPDTVRAREPSQHRDRPSLEHGADLLHGTDSVSNLLRRRAGALYDERLPMPRVYSDEEPDATYINPWLLDRPDHAPALQPDAIKTGAMSEGYLSTAAQSAARHARRQ